MLNTVIKQAASQNRPKPGDYEENGLLMCGKCHKPKQKRLNRPDGEVCLVPLSCQCSQIALEREQEEKEMRDFRVRMQELQGRFRVSDETYQRFTFDVDDRLTPKLSNICRQYVERWPEMKENNAGILFYGSVGTGKSFYACAIANALLERRVSATVTNFPRLLNILQGARDRQAVIDHLQSYQLLVIDDLGAERDSSYGAEQIFNVIDSRVRSELPLIVTTNLSLEELKNPPNMQLARIYDRVLEMCPIPLVMSGASRRTENAKRRTELARDLLKGE